MAVELFPCLGLSFLGSCAYNPAQPSPVYFTIGDAVAALALTLAIQQFLKPIVVFRLRAYGLSIRYLILFAFVGFGCAIIAALLPNLPVAHDNLFEYPIFWELIGGALIGATYAVAAFIALGPARIYNFNLPAFVRAGAALLSSADDNDRVSFAEDLLRSPHNLARLINYAKAWEEADAHASALKFDELRQAGKPLSFQGRAPISAFYLFAHRRKLEAGSYANRFLRILSDPQFCSVLVSKCAWLVASSLREIAGRRLHTSAAESFVQEMARQAIVNDESMLTREVSYDGFGTVAVFANSLFRNPFILRYYSPLQKLQFGGDGEPTRAYTSRLTEAAGIMLDTAIERSDWGCQYMWSVESAYESLSRQIDFRRHKGIPNDFLLSFHMSVEALYEKGSEGLAALDPKLAKGMYMTKTQNHRHDLTQVIAGIVYESLASVANGFLGYNDDAWLYAHGIFDKLYPQFGDVPPGLDPIQQQVAIKLVAKLRDNMQGWYPAISRVLLAAIGPYEQKPESKVRTAFLILKDAVYTELQKLSGLHVDKPSKTGDFLPQNVTYDAVSDTLTHVYSGGSQQTTTLRDLTISEIDLFDEINWRFS